MERLGVLFDLALEYPIPAFVALLIVVSGALHLTAFFIELLTLAIRRLKHDTTVVRSAWDTFKHELPSLKKSADSNATTTEIEAPSPKADVTTSDLGAAPTAAVPAFGVNPGTARRSAGVPAMLGTPAGLIPGALDGHAAREVRE